MSQTSNMAGSESNAGASGPATERLTTKAHDTVDRVGATVNRAAHDTVDRAATTANRTATTANRAADEVRAAAASTVDAAKHAQEKAIAARDESLRMARSYVERHPLTSVGNAAVFGAILTTLIVRR